MKGKQKMRKMSVGKGLVAAIAAVCSFVSFGEGTEYILDKNKALINSANWSADGGTTKVTPDAAPAGSVFRCLTTAWVVTYEMPGKLILGLDDGTTGGGLNNNEKPEGLESVLTADIDWTAGTIQNINTGILTIEGSINVKTAKTHTLATSKTCALTVNSDLSSDATDVKIALGRSTTTSWTYAEVNDSAPSGQMRLMGDNSGYKGTFEYAASQTRRPLVLGGNEPLGDPNTPNDRAFYISGSSCVLAVAGDCAQSANRGLYFNSTSTSCFGAWKGSDCDGHTLSYPIASPNDKSTRGNFIKVGNGTFRYNGALTYVKSIAVSNGTFVVGKDVTVTPVTSENIGTTFTVGTGARLVIEQGAQIDDVKLVTLEGGEISYEELPITVPFDGTTAETVTQSVTLAEGYIQPIKLSQPFTLPILATNRVAALVIPNGEFKLADFRDDTPKAAYGLPTTWLELEKDEATGDQTLYIVARPAVASTANNKVYTLNEWSDGSSPHLGADYYQFDCAGVARRTTTGSYSSNAVTFDGSSLTLAGENSKTVSYSGAFNVSDFRLWPLATVNFNAGSSATKDVVGGLGGNLSVCGDVTTWDNPSVLYSGNYMANVKLSMKMGGAGAVRYYSGNTTSDATVLTISGDNSAFGGQWIFEEHNDAGSFVEVVVTNGTAFGGALTRFADNAVTITTDPSKTVSRQTERMVINPTASMTVDAANRGWMTTCGCGFRMPAGVTLTFAPPRFTVGGEILKDGAGTWAFACGELVAADAAKLTVAEGAISQLKEGCLSELPIVFAGGGICVDVNADAGTKEKGIVAKSLALAEGTETIPVTFANLPDVRTASATEVHVAILTAPAGSPEFQFVAKAPKGYKVTLTSAPGEDGATVYSADLVPKGVLLIVR